MRALFVCVLMLTAAVAFQETATAPVLAQGKDKGKVTKGKEGVIVISEGKDGKFRFVIRDDDEGKLLAMSSPGGFATVKDAQKAIDELKDVLKTAKVTVKKDDKDKKDKDKK